MGKWIAIRHLGKYGEIGDEIPAELAKRCNDIYKVPHCKYVPSDKEAEEESDKLKKFNEEQKEEKIAKAVKSRENKPRKSKKVKKNR